MDQKSFPSLQIAATALESALEEFETIGESEDCQPLRKSAERLIDVLVLLHGLDPDLLNAKSLARIADRAEAAKPKSGRNSFNTGF